MHHVYLLEGNKGPSIAMDLLLFKWTQECFTRFRALCLCLLCAPALADKKVRNFQVWKSRKTRPWVLPFSWFRFGLSVGDVMNKTAMCGWSTKINTSLASVSFCHSCCCCCCCCCCVVLLRAQVYFDYILGVLLCSGLCPPIWRNRSYKSILLLKNHFVCLFMLKASNSV